MGKINFKVQPRTKKGKILSNEYGTIAVRFTNGRGGCDFLARTPIKVKPKDWNNRTKRLKVTMVDNGANEVNELLNSIETLFVNRISSMSITDEILTREKLDDWIQEYFKLEEKQNRNNKNSTDPSIYVLDFVENWIAEDMDQVIYKGKPLAKSTKSMHTWMKNKLKAYETNVGVRLRFAKMDDKTQLQLVSWLLFEEDLKLASLNQFTQVLRKLIVNYAIRQNINVHPQFPSESFKNKTTVQKKYAYLNIEDIEKINRLNLIYDKELDAVKDWLLLSCNIGTSFSDTYNLDFDLHFDTKKKIISNTRQKTNTPFAVPYKSNHIVEGIIEKYNGLPPIDKASDKGNLNTQWNKQFRQICKLAGLDYLVSSVYRDDEDGVTREGEVEKWKAIYTHTCRRSFATNLYGLIPEADLLLYGGWKTPTMLNTYVKKTAFEKADMTIDRLSKINKQRSDQYLKKVV